MVTDYNYGNHRAGLSDSDSGQNSAQALAGYPLDVQPNADWPGTEGNPRELHVDKHGMLAVADTIDGLIEDIGTIDVTQAGNVSFGPDSWQAALFLKDASGQVAGAVNQYARELVTNLQAASAAIRAAAGQYGSAEQTSADSVNTVQGNLDGSSQAPAGNTQPW
jgi:hypothetical protein